MLNRSLAVALVVSLLTTFAGGSVISASTILRSVNSGTIYLASGSQPPGTLTLSARTVTPMPTQVPVRPTPTVPPLAGSPSAIPPIKLSALTNREAGTKVRVVGTTVKWEPSMRTPPVSRSDWVLADDTGFIWITGVVSPKVGVQIVVNGVLVREKGRLFIRVVG